MRNINAYTDIGYQQSSCVLYQETRSKIRSKMIHVGMHCMQEIAARKAIKGCALGINISCVAAMRHGILHLVRQAIGSSLPVAVLSHEFGCLSWVSLQTTD